MEVRRIKTFAQWGVVVTLLCLGAAGCQNQRQLPMDALDWSKPLQSSDPYELLRMTVEQDVLYATVQYSGGCTSHVFELVENGPLVRSMPPKQPLALVHDARGDACRQVVVESIEFDLKSFRAGPRGLTVLSMGDTLLPYRYD